MEMRFYWMCDHVAQGQFNVYYRKGEYNLGDYQSKHHPTAHYIKMRPTYLHEPNPTHSNLQGCVNPTVSTNCNKCI